MPETPDPTPEAFKLDPRKLPTTVELELSPSTLEQLERRAGATGRSIDELILELLNQELGRD